MSKKIIYNPVCPRNMEEAMRLLKEKNSIDKTAEMLNISRHAVFKISKGIETYDRGNIISVSFVSDTVFNKLHEIAKKRDMNFSDFMRREFKRIAEAYK